MTRMRDAAVQLLVASSACRDSLAQHNRLLVLELEEARARIRVLQVPLPPIVTGLVVIIFYCTSNLIPLILTSHQNFMRRAPCVTQPVCSTRCPRQA